MVMKLGDCLAEENGNDVMSALERNDRAFHRVCVGVAEDAWNGIVHQNGRKCEAETAEGCRETKRTKEGKESSYPIKYVMTAWGVNGNSEDFETEAPSLAKAINNVRFKAANCDKRRIKDISMKIKMVAGHEIKKNVIISCYEKVNSRIISELDRSLRSFVERNRVSRVDGQGRVGQGVDNPIHANPVVGGWHVGRVPEAVPPKPDNQRSPDVQNGRTHSRLVQSEFSFDAAMRKYLACCEDAWVDSGTGNMAWKEDKPTKKRKRPIDRLPKSTVIDIICGNVSLIRTIGGEMFPELATKIYRVLTGKLVADRVIDWLCDECGVSDERAYLILSDQLRKAIEQMKVEDWKRRGIEFAVWKHCAGENEPRDYHLRNWDGKSGLDSGIPNGLNGFVFRLDDPPVIDLKTGERGYPSTLIGCKCYIKGIRR